MTRAARRDTQPGKTEAWITGIGLVSSLGEGGALHLRKLGGDAEREDVPPMPNVDHEMLAPYCLHPLCETDFSSQIPRRGDLRQMGRWQQIGVYAAGLALADAGIAGRPEILGDMDMNIAAGNGERDSGADRNVLEALSAGRSDEDEDGAVLNQALQAALRPTLYLAELSNLLAGNISIVHGVAGSSRTFKGEELAGVSAIEDAVRRIRHGQGSLFLVGAAFNAERWDVVLGQELCGSIWRGPHASVWERAARGGGLATGSVGAFLVIESRHHAEERGITPYARISNAVSGRCKRNPDGSGINSLADLLLERLRPCPTNGPLAVLSGASGVEPATSAELNWLKSLEDRGLDPGFRAYGSLLGHSLEAHFPVGIALAGLAAKENVQFPPFDSSGLERPQSPGIRRYLVTGFGHWRGEGLALVETVNEN